MMVPIIGPRIDPRPPIRIAMKNRIEQVEGQGVRSDIGLQRRDGRGDRRIAPPSRKIGNQQPRLGYAGRLRPHFRVADRDRGASEPAQRDIGRDPGAATAYNTESVVAPGRIEGRRNSGPGMPMPPPVTLCQASAIWVTMVAKPSVDIANRTCAFAAPAGRR